MDSDRDWSARLEISFNGQPYGYLLTLGELYELDFASNTGKTETYRIRADGRLLGEVRRTGSASPLAGTFYLTDNVGSVVAEANPSPGARPLRHARDATHMGAC